MNKTYLTFSSILLFGLLLITTFLYFHCKNIINNCINYEKSINDKTESIDDLRMERRECLIFLIDFINAFQEKSPIEYSYDYLLKDEGFNEYYGLTMLYPSKAHDSKAYNEIKKHIDLSNKRIQKSIEERDNLIIEYEKYNKSYMTKILSYFNNYQPKQYSLSRKEKIFEIKTKKPQWKIGREIWFPNRIGI